MLLSKLLKEIEWEKNLILKEDPEIEHVTSRSQDVKQSTLFIALQGTKQTGMNYITQAIEHGAVAILCDTLPNFFCSVPILLCKNPRLALSIFCNIMCGEPTKNMKVIGVTGTNGKSSTLFFLKHFLEKGGKRVGLCSTVEDYLLGKSLGTSGMTTQDPEELYPKLKKMSEAKIEYLLLEVSSHALAQEKVAPIHFHAALFTNISPEHLDFHKTMEAYKCAKGKLLSMAKYAIIPHDLKKDPVLERALSPQTFTYSKEGRDADFIAVEPTQTENGIRYHFLYKELIFRIKIPLFGNFTYDNSLLAISCAFLEGIEQSVLQAGATTLPAVKGRLEPFLSSLPSLPFSIFLDYAHTPDALERVLSSIKSLQLVLYPNQNGRLCLLFGCGGDRDPYKRSPMGKMAAKYADFIILTEDNSRNELPEEIFTDILSEIPKDKLPLLIRNRKDAIYYLVRQARKGDILLLTGKGHETYQIQAEGTYPFDEREFLEEACCLYHRKEKKEDSL